jgi:hypothetical protein
MHVSLTKADELKTLDLKNQWLLKAEFLKLILKLREYDKQLGSFLNVKTHHGRLKSQYRVSGTETGRWSCAKFVDGSGVNAQQITREGVEVAST